MSRLRFVVAALVIAIVNEGTSGSRLRAQNPVDIWISKGSSPTKRESPSKRCCCDSDLGLVVALCKWVEPKSNGRCPEFDLGRGMSQTHHALGLGLLNECPDSEDEVRRVYTLSRNRKDGRCCCDTELGLDGAVCKYVKPNWRGHCPTADLGRGESQTHLAASFGLSCNIQDPSSVPSSRTGRLSTQGLRDQTQAQMTAMRSQVLFAQALANEMKNAQETMSAEVARVYGNEIRCCCDTDLGLESVKCKFVTPNWRGKCPKANLGRGYSQTHSAVKSKLVCDVDEAVNALWERRSRCCCDTNLGSQGALCRRTIPKWNGRCPVADFGRGKSQTHEASSVGLVCGDENAESQPAQRLNKDRDTCLAQDALDLSFAPMGAEAEGPDWLARWPMVLGTPDENIYVGVTSIQVNDLDAKVLVRKVADMDNGFEYEIMGSNGRELAVGSLMLGIKMDMPGLMGSLVDWAFGDKTWALDAEMRFTGHALQDEQGNWHFIQTVNKMKLHTKSWLPLARVALALVNSHGGVGNMVFHSLEAGLVELLSGASKQEVLERAHRYAEMGKKIVGVDSDGLQGLDLQGMLLQHEFTLRGKQETEDAPLDMHIAWKGQTVMKQDALWSFLGDRGLTDTLLTEFVSREERIIKRRRITAAFRAHLRDGLDLEVAPSPLEPSVQCFTGFFCASSLCRPSALGRMEMQCPHGEVITGIAFASLGTPQGTCSDDDLDVDTGGCDVLPGALGQAVLAKCQGRAACTLEGGNAVFNSFLPSESLDEERRDKCPDITHVLAAVQIHCSSTAMVLDAQYAFGPADTYKVFPANWATFGRAVKLHRPSQFNRYKDKSFVDVNFIVSDAGKYDISLRYELEFGEREHDLDKDLDFKFWALVTSRSGRYGDAGTKFSIPVDVHLEYDQFGSITQRSKPFDDSVVCCCDVVETDEETGHGEETHCAWLARGSENVCPEMDLGNGVRQLFEAPYDNDNLVQLCASLLERFAGVGDGTKVQVHAGRVDLPVVGISTVRLLEATNLPVGSYTLRVAVPQATLYLAGRDLHVDHVLLAKSPSHQRDSLELPKSLSQALLDSAQGFSGGSSTVRLRGPVDATLDETLAQDLTTFPVQLFPREGHAGSLDGRVPREFVRPFSDNFADRDVYRFMKMVPDLSVTGALKLAAPRDEDQAVVNRLDVQLDMKLDLKYMLKAFVNSHGTRDFGYIYKSGTVFGPSGENLWALLNCGVVHLYTLNTKPGSRLKPYVSVAVEDLRMCDATGLGEALACTDFVAHFKSDKWCIKLTKKRQLCLGTLPEITEWARAIHLQRRRFDSDSALTALWNFGTNDLNDTIVNRKDSIAPTQALIDLYAKASALQKL